MKPRIGLVAGDPAGIGPELAAKLLADPQTSKRAHVAFIGDRRILAEGEKAAGVSLDVTVVKDLADAAFEDGKIIVVDGPSLDPKDVVLTQATKLTGAWQLGCLAKALGYTQTNQLDAMCFAPLNKHAMHLGGLVHDDELPFFLDTLQFKGDVGLLNTLGNIWTSRVTSHVAHKDVSDLITEEAIIQAVKVMDATMRQAGCDKPRIAVAALNPHGGDGGAFGREEIDVIEPAVKAVCDGGIQADGPYPADTIFIKARDGVYDAIVTMYHDQGQIAMKLMGFDSGVTVHAGLPVPVTTSAHGSAYDIAGQGKANVEALRHAFQIAARMAEAA